MQPPEAGRALADIVEARAVDLSEESGYLSKVAAIEWSSLDTDETLRQQAPRLAEALRLNFPERFTELVDAWAEKILENLSNECIDWLSSRFADLDEEQRSAVTEALRKITEGETTQHQVSAYGRFLSALDHRSKQSEEIRTHLNSTLDRTIEILPNQTSIQNPALAPQVEQAQQFLVSIMPTLAPLLAQADNENAAHFIDRVFGSAINIADDPNIYGILHVEMADRWPDPASSHYDMDSVLGTAERVCSERPEESALTGVLRSLLSLHDMGGLADEQSQRRLAGIAASLWLNEPQDIEPLLMRIDASPEPHVASSIAQGLDLTGEPDERHERLRRVWEHWLRRMNEEEQLQATRNLLQVETAAPHQDGDAALRLWIGAMPARHAVLHELVQDQAVTDDNLARLWWQTCANAPVVGQAFFLENLSTTLGWDDSEKTWKAVIDCKDQVSALFGAQTEKNALGRALVEAYLACPSRSTKGEILQWIAELNALNELRARDQSTLSEEDLEQIDAVFGPGWRRKSRK